MSCQSFASDVSNQIQASGNRLNAEIEITASLVTTKVCANNGEHSNCIRRFTVTRRSIYLPRLQAAGQPFVVSKNI
jgi:hypothetical protein